jgi:hypothetical protein
MMCRRALMRVGTAQAMSMRGNLCSDFSSLCALAGALADAQHEQGATSSMAISDLPLRRVLKTDEDERTHMIV